MPDPQILHRTAAVFSRDPHSTGHSRVVRQFNTVSVPFPLKNHGGGECIVPLAGVFQMQPVDLPLHRHFSVVLPEIPLSFGLQYDKASYQVKVGDVIEIAFGQRTLKVEVTEINEHATKSDASAMYREIAE